MTIPYQTGRDPTVAQLLDTNIDITTLANGDTLVYNSSTGQWDNGEGNPLIGLESSTATIGNPFDDTYTILTFKNDRTPPAELGCITSFKNTLPGDIYYYLQFKPQCQNTSTQGIIFRHDENATETRVGINVIDPEETLDVEGNIQLRGGAQGKIFFKHPSGLQKVELDGNQDGTNGGKFIVKTKVVDGSMTQKLEVNNAGAIGLGASPNFGTSGQVLTSNGSGSSVTWATISGGGTPETIVTLSGMNFSSIGVGELIKKVDASNAGGSGIVTSEASVGGVDTHAIVTKVGATTLSNITTQKDASNNYSITLEPQSGSGRNVVLTDDGTTIELGLSGTGVISVGQFNLESTPATSDPVKTFNRLKTTKEQILSTDAVSQGLPDPNKNEPITCQALLDSTANAVIASTNASGLHLLPPSGSVLKTHLDNLTVPTLKTSALPTLTNEIGYYQVKTVASGITIPVFSNNVLLTFFDLPGGVHNVKCAFTVDRQPSLANYGTTAFLNQGTGGAVLTENFTVVVNGGFTTNYVNDTVIVPYGTTLRVEFRAYVGTNAVSTIQTVFPTKCSAVRIA